MQLFILDIPPSTTKNGVLLRNFSTVVFFMFLWYLEGSRYIMIYIYIYTYKVYKGSDGFLGLQFVVKPKR